MEDGNSKLEVKYHLVRDIYAEGVKKKKKFVDSFVSYSFCCYSSKGSV